MGVTNLSTIMFSDWRRAMLKKNTGNYSNFKSINV